jgi:hypothetical protein
LTIQSIIFNDPPGIQHTANLTNLGGNGAVTGNSVLNYSLIPGNFQTFTVDYDTTTVPAGTYTGTIDIGGTNGQVQTITSTIVVRNA